MAWTLAELPSCQLQSVRRPSQDYPTLATLAAVAAALGVSLAELIADV